MGFGGLTMWRNPDNPEKTLLSHLEAAYNANTGKPWQQR